MENIKHFETDAEKAYLPERGHTPPGLSAVI